MEATPMTAIQILIKYENIWDLTVPTTEELHELYREFGVVTPSKIRKVRFTVLHKDGVWNFNSRREAWDFYLMMTGMYAPIRKPW